MTIEEFNKLKNPEVIEFLLRHLNHNPEQFALRYSGKSDFPYRAISEQIFCNKKAKAKLPSLSNHQLIYERTALEQCSGELTAEFKSRLVNGSSIIDLTGGLGIDTIAFSHQFKDVIYCEQNYLIKEIFTYNANKLKIPNVVIKEGDGTDLLKTFPDNYFSWIYVDPSRRVLNRRIVGLQNCLPNITDNIDLLFQKSCNIMIKASPAVEIEEIRKQLIGIKDIYIVSVDNECKEVLILLQKDYNDIINISSVLINHNSRNHIIISEKIDNKFVRIISDKVLKYFYEPDAAIIKARLTAKIASSFDLFYLNDTVDYLVSDNYISTFPGRVFEVIDSIVFSRNRFKEFLLEHKIVSANIARRDFPDSPETLKRKYKIKDGGEDFLFFTKDLSERLISILCRKIPS